MQHAVMRASETVIFEQPVGVADEIAIGEEEQLHEIERLAVAVRAPAPASRGDRRQAASGPARLSFAVEVRSL